MRAKVKYQSETWSPFYNVDRYIYVEAGFLPALATNLLLLKIKRMESDILFNTIKKSVIQHFNQDTIFFVTLMKTISTLMA